jgi:hypothetical protein
VLIPVGSGSPGRRRRPASPRGHFPGLCVEPHKSVRHLTGSHSDLSIPQASACRSVASKSAPACSEPMPTRPWRAPPKSPYVPRIQRAIRRFGFLDSIRPSQYGPPGFTGRTCRDRC